MVTSLVRPPIMQGQKGASAAPSSGTPPTAQVTTQHAPVDLAVEAPVAEGHDARERLLNVVGPRVALLGHQNRVGLLKAAIDVRATKDAAIERQARALALNSLPDVGSATNESPETVIDSLIASALSLGMTPEDLADAAEAQLGPTRQQVLALMQTDTEIEVDDSVFQTQCRMNKIGFFMQQVAILFKKLKVGGHSQRWFHSFWDYYDDGGKNVIRIDPEREFAKLQPFSNNDSWIALDYGYKKGWIPFFRELQSVISLQIDHDNNVSITFHDPFVYLKLRPVLEDMIAQANCLPGSKSHFTIAKIKTTFSQEQMQVAELQARDAK